MSSPSKKRKLNNDSKNGKGQSKGLEYFFSRQRTHHPSPAPRANDTASAEATEHLTDEELARKMQAEWNNETEPQNQEMSSKESLSSDNQPGELNVATSPTNEVPSSGAATESKPLAEQHSSMSGKTLSLQSAGMAEDTTTINIPFDESPVTFEPSKYVNQLKHYWDKDGGDASYALLTRCFVIVSRTTSRIKIVDTLVNCLRVLIEGDPESLLPAVSE
jgi:DNA ligase-1